MLEPLRLYGPGEYNLNVVKEIVPTESFLGMDKEVRGCQNDEAYEDCTTKLFRKTMIAECNCLPYNIGLNEKVLHVHRDLR